MGEIIKRYYPSSKEKERRIKENIKLEQNKKQKVS